MRTQWSFVQIAVLVLATVLTLWSLAGLIVNPDFTTGASAPTEQVLGIDFNGWHAVSGFLLFAPAFVAVARREWALAYAIAAGLALFVTSVWIWLDTEPLFVLHLPNNASDAVFHMFFALAFLTAAAIQIRQDRSAA